ncbi:MAG: acyltransferase family protein, partial [Beijerinckiaceae bacterium]
MSEPAGQHGRHTYYRADIDGLRAIAVLLVLAFHAKLTPALSGGFIGVDVFFVISGFLITSIIRREIQAGSFSILGFYERRIRRIFPALTAVILACIVAGLILLPPQQMRDLARSALSAIGFYSNFHFLSQMGYFQPDVDTLPLLHTWSLGIEEQFYVVAPLLVLFLLTKAPRLERPVLIGIAILSFAYAVWLVGRDRDTAFYVPMTRAWELLIGALLATGMRPVASRPLREG